jgi:modification methylase
MLFMIIANGTPKIDTEEDLYDHFCGKENLDDLIPTLARNPAAIRGIESFAQRRHTSHELILGDSRAQATIPNGSVHLVLTSPPYWTLKRYNDSAAQLGHISDYSSFIESLNAVWSHCFRLLVPGGRLVCVVGDVCLSRRQNNGRHTVVPLHASIQESCKAIGFDNLAPIIWHKIANAKYEAEGSGGFLGKPYEPNAVIKNDIEFILMQRKPGGYRSPSKLTRLLSLISAKNYSLWFNQIWHDVTGASTAKHPAPYPETLAERLVRMFSFVGDTVYDPFMGSGTTNLAAARWGRNSIGVEIDPEYYSIASRRLEKINTDLYYQITIKQREAS